ncbi:MAG: hypothetical protein M3Y27_16005 [Acidobacteriota bacterium]|nr:hypothetical protein [Acidobacteriota bacterium]
MLFDPAGFRDPQSVLNAKGAPIVPFGNSPRVARGPGSRYADLLPPVGRPTFGQVLQFISDRQTDSVRLESEL